MRTRTRSTSAESVPGRDLDDAAQRMTAYAFPLIEVRGDSYEMGWQHGEQASELVHRCLLWIEKLTGLAREVLMANAIAFLPAIQAASASLPMRSEAWRTVLESRSRRRCCARRAPRPQVLECKCHFSRFTLRGERVAVPAERGTDLFSIRLQNGEFVVRTGELKWPDRSG